MLPNLSKTFSSPTPSPGPIFCIAISILKWSSTETLSTILTSIISISWTISAYGLIFGSPTTTPIHPVMVLAAAYDSAKLNPLVYDDNKTLGDETAVKYGSYTYPLIPLAPSSKISAIRDWP